MGIKKEHMTINKVRKSSSNIIDLHESAAVKVLNSAFVGRSGALGPGDRGTPQHVPYYTGNPYEMNNPAERWRQLYHLYQTSWEARKIVRIPIEDALRKRWMVEDIPDDVRKKISKTLDAVDFVGELSRSLMLERLLGGSISFLGLSSDQDDPSIYFDPQKTPSKLCFVNTVPLSRIARVGWETNPLKSGYMRPVTFTINGQEVHRSRCLVWDGEPLIDASDFAISPYYANISGFGNSILISIWDDIRYAVGSRQAAYHLIQTNNALIMAVNEMASLQGTKPGERNIDRLKEVANNLSLYRAVLLDKGKAEISQHSASFGSVPELLIAYLQVLSAASDIPATRFLGQSPGGLNATGESDLENYYNVIDSIQRHRIEPALRRVYDIIGYYYYPDKWKEFREQMTIHFPPLWNLSELEEAQRNSVYIDNALKLYEQGLISDQKFFEEINAKDVFSVDLDETDASLAGADDIDIGRKEGITVEEDKEDLEQLPKPGQQRIKGAVSVTPNTYSRTTSAPIGPQPDGVDSIGVRSIENNGEFKEQDHPRDEDGKFSSGSGEAPKAKKDNHKPIRPKSAPVAKKPAKIKKIEKTEEQKKAEAIERHEKAIAHHTEKDKDMHRKAREMGLAVPPAWTDVKIHTDPNSIYVAEGVDAKGRNQHLYSKFGMKEKDRKKWTRTSTLSKKMPQIMEKISNDVEKGSGEEAKVLYLIATTGFRIGSDKNTKTEKQAYGASTLLRKHVEVSGDTVKFEFTGKSGQHQQHEIKNKPLAKIVYEATKGKKADERLFNTDGTKTINYFRKIAGGKYVNKDLRTLVGTDTAQRMVKTMEPPKTQKELQEKIMEVSKIVSKRLGNTPVMARDSYINPIVFGPWRAALNE